MQLELDIAQYITDLTLLEINRLSLYIVQNYPNKAPYRDNGHSPKKVLSLNSHGHGCVFWIGSYHYTVTEKSQSISHIPPAHCTIYTVLSSLCTLHTTPRTLHNAHFTLEAAYCTLQTTHWTQKMYGEHFTLQIALCTLKLQRLTPNTKYFIRNTENWTQQCAHCTAHA